MRGAVPAAPSTRLPDGSPAASAARPRSSSARSAPTTAARCSRAPRVTASEKATSTGCASGSAVSRSCSLAAWPRSASRLFAESTQGSTAGATGSAWTAGSGACSMMACALVPLTPKDETPARRGRPVSGHARASVSSSTAPADQSTCGVGSSTCRVCGSTPWRIAMTILMIPAAPAAAWVWPRFDLIEPSQSGRSSVCSSP